MHEVPEYTGPLGTAGDQAAPTVEKPEFNGGVNAVEALVHELPEYTGPLSTVGNQAAPTVEKPEFKGGVNAVMALVHELPEYRPSIIDRSNQPARQLRSLSSRAVSMQLKPWYMSFQSTGPLSIGNQAAQTVEKPEFKLSSLASDQGKMPDYKK